MLGDHVPRGRWKGSAGRLSFVLLGANYGIHPQRQVPELYNYGLHPHFSITFRAVRITNGLTT